MIDVKDSFVFINKFALLSLGNLLFSLNTHRTSQFKRFYLGEEGNIRSYFLYEASIIITIKKYARAKNRKFLET
jgi:hypothetical protein